MDAFDRAAQRETRARHDRRTRPVWGRFFLHLRIYLAVNAALLALWLLTTAITAHDSPWFRGPLVGWGIGLLVHYIVVTQVTRQWRPPLGETAPRSEGEGP